MMVSASPTRVLLSLFTLCCMAMMSFCNFCENQVAQLINSFLITYIVVTRALKAYLLPC